MNLKVLGVSAEFELRIRKYGTAVSREKWGRLEGRFSVRGPRGWLPLLICCPNTLLTVNKLAPSPLSPSNDSNLELAAD